MRMNRSRDKLVCPKCKIELLNYQIKTHVLTCGSAKVVKQPKTTTYIYPDIHPVGYAELPIIDGYTLYRYSGDDYTVYYDQNFKSIRYICQYAIRTTHITIDAADIIKFVPSIHYIRDDGYIALPNWVEKAIDAFAISWKNLNGFDPHIVNSGYQNVIPMYMTYAGLNIYEYLAKMTT